MLRRQRSQGVSATNTRVTAVGIFSTPRAVLHLQRHAADMPEIKKKKKREKKKDNSSRKDGDRAAASRGSLRVFFHQTRLIHLTRLISLTG